MGRRGPAPTPTPILEARGSWRAKERKGEPRPPVERPSCPAMLTGEAREEWGRQVELLAEMGVIAKVDRAALAAWCEAWGEFVECCEAIRQGDDGKGANKGRVLAGSMGNPVQSPYVRIKNAAVDRLVKLAAQFGFTPAARSRINAVETGEPPADELEDFLARGRAAKAAKGAG